MSIQAQIVTIVVTILLSASSLVTIFALRSTNTTLRKEAIDAVGSAASTRRDLLFSLLRQYGERVHSRLHLAHQLCHDVNNSRDCEQIILTNFRDGVGASSLTLSRHAGKTLTLGMPADNFAEIPLPDKSQLARFGRGRDGKVYFQVREFEGGDELRVIFPVDNVTSIFANHEDLGETGESFLSDEKGRFLTPGRFATQEILNHPVHSQIMMTCLSGKNGEEQALDYRDAHIIHGYRSLPEIGGGCIMSHIDEAAAFERSTKLARNIIDVTLITVLIALILAVWASRLITRPIQRLAAHAKALQAGDFTQTISHDGPSEIQTFALAFSEMANTLISEIQTRKRFQQRSDEQKVQFEAIFNSISDGAVFVGLDRNVLLANPAFLSMFGYKENEIIGKSTRLLYINESDYETRGSTFSEMQAGSGKLFSISFRRRSGEIFASESMVARVINSEKKAVGYIAIIRDISAVKFSQAELQDSEERFRRAVMEAPYPIMIRNDLGEILQVNHIWTKMTGYRQGEIANVEDWVKIASRDTEQSDELLRLIKETAANTIRHDLGEFKIITKDGQLLLWNISITPLGETRGGRKLMMSMATDVTELKRSERELSKAVRSRDDFLATLSHELRTPMNIILGWLEILRSGKYDQALYAQALETLSRNAKVQKDLIDDLLDVSRIISGKFSLNCEPTDLAQLTLETTNSLLPRAAEKSIEMTVELAPEKLLISADSTKVIQVEVNLLQNALKFTPRGGRIQVRLTKDAGEAVLTISDTGVGIEQSFLPHVFDRLRQEDMGTTRAHAGLGLGLAISRHIIESHNGRIDASSSGRGKGATFSVRIPLLETEALSPVAKAVETKPTRMSLQKLRVLIVDDSQDILFLIRTWLEQEGVQVSEAGSANEGLQLLSREKFDILLSDIGMPGEDGYQFIGKVRASAGVERFIPAIALTAYAREEERTRVVQAGFQMHIAKPTTKAIVIQTIQNLLERQERSREDQPQV